MPTVPEYPEEPWTAQLGLPTGDRRRWQMAMMEPKRAIPESGMAEQEKVITGAAAGAGKAPTKIDPSFEASKSKLGKPTMYGKSEAETEAAWKSESLQNQMDHWGSKFLGKTKGNPALEKQAVEQYYSMEGEHGNEKLSQAYFKMYEKFKAGKLKDPFEQKPYEFTKEEMKAGEWIQQNIPANKQESMKGIVGSAKTYRINDEYEDKHSQYGTHRPREFEPVDWKALQNEYIRMGAKVPESKAEQAKELGYNIKYPMYRGSTTTEQELLARRTMHDPGEKEHERAHFFAESPDIAGEYKRSYGGVTEFVASPKNPAVIDLKGKGYDSDHMHDIVEGARAKGHDLVVIKNIWDIGGKQNQVIVTDPGILRHPSAKFDPKSHGLNDLLATLLATVGTGAVTKELMGKDAE